MDESDGVFAKRRRNLLIAGVVIIIISIANPNLEKLKLFDIEFNFKNRQWQIWLGLFLWFSYTVIRVWTYYFTYIHQEYLKAKRNFIYSTFEGKKYFYSILEKRRYEIEQKRKREETSRISVNYDNFEQRLNSYIDDGEIPGKAVFILNVVKNLPIASTSTLTEEIEFAVNSNMKAYFKKRKRQFILNDNWWEYVFLIIFSSVVLVSLISSWIRII